MGKSRHGSNFSCETAPAVGGPCSFRSPELRGLRKLPIAGFPKHLVFYRFDDEEVFVIRVVHGARDLESLFS